MTTLLRRIVTWAGGLLLAGSALAQVTSPALPEEILIEPEILSTPAGQALADTQAAFRASFGSNDGLATERAKELVALVAEVYGSPHANLSLALTNLAIAQAAATEHRAAVENFTTAIDIRESADGTLVSPELINPLRGLANTFLALDETELAIPALERAIHVSHVNEGPNNLAQIPVLDNLSQAYLIMGEVDEASDIQDTMFRVQQRRYDSNSDEYADALLSRARWYERIEDFTQATSAYRRIVATLATIHGGNDIRLIDPLVHLAVVSPLREGGPGTRTNGFAMDTGESEARRSMSRAVRIARANADTDPTLLPTTLVQQGDWLMRYQSSRRARASYREAWSLLDADPALHVFRDAFFGKPSPVRRQQMRRAHDREVHEKIDSRNFPQRGFVEVRYDINVMGRPVNIEVVDSEPAGLMDGHVVRAIRSSVYRPAFADGQPVESRGLTLRHTFRYDEKRISDSERSSMVATEQARAAAAAVDNQAVEPSPAAATADPAMPDEDPSATTADGNNDDS